MTGMDPSFAGVADSAGSSVMGSQYGSEDSLDLYARRDVLQQLLKDANVGDHYADAYVHTDTLELIRAGFFFVFFFLPSSSIQLYFLLKY